MERSPAGTRSLRRDEDKWSGVCSRVLVYQRTDVTVEADIKCLITSITPAEPITPSNAKGKGAQENGSAWGGSVLLKG